MRLETVQESRTLASAADKSRSRGGSRRAPQAARWFSHGLKLRKSVPKKRLWIPVHAVLAGLLLSGLVSAEKSAVGEYQVKAAFLYHFTKFVEWPASGPSRDPTTICVLGEDPFGPILDFTFEDKTVRGKPFEVRRLGIDADLVACHVLFLSASEKGQATRILRAVQNLPVLTVADAREFGAAGGMIQLFVEESKVRFDINLTSAKNSRLRISAQLLRLARTVDGK